MVNICAFFSHLIGGRCALCQAPADGLCGACLASLPRNLHACRRCALPLPDAAPAGSLCAACQTRPPPFDLAVAPLRYARPVDDLIGRFKYHHQLPLGRVLGGLLGHAVQGRHDLPSLLLPVPASAARLRTRGFNQAAELVRTLAGHLGLDWNAGQVYRTRDADPQRGLSRGERRRNLRGAFACRGRLPSHVALVDDVITTGATVEEAGRMLRRAGVKRLEVWAVARTPLRADTGATD